MGRGYNFSTAYIPQRVGACLGLVILVIAGKNWTLAVGIETDTYSNDTETYQNTPICNVESHNASVDIPEDANVGDIVFEDKNVSGGRGSFFLEEVNMEGTFKLDHQNGTIFLTRYLDCSVRNIYVLLLSRREMLHGNKTVCLFYNITVIVNDVIGWPPFFNESCAWPIRKADKYVSL
ncbi:protocadherin Fat 4-like [Ptychodera flava]|uniref:protocadherin Fat 4-like n=1 Tax=Ptychodera flava TaxID=63121 RepID=UPI003969DEBB